MAKRIVLGGVVGGVLVFFWGYVSHMVLGLGEVGIKSLPTPAEEVAMKALQLATRDEPGFYFFPGMGEPQGTPEAKKAAEERAKEKYRKGPHGILVYQPQGEEPVSPKRLGIQVATEIVSALLAACVLGLAAGGLQSFLARLLVVTLLGLFIGTGVLLPYWNWYGFPADFAQAQIADKVIGWFIGGIGLAAIVRRPAA